MAALDNVIRSKEAAGRRKDFQALPELHQLAGHTGSPEPSGDTAAAAQRFTDVAHTAAARARVRVRRGRRPPEA